MDAAEELVHKHKDTPRRDLPALENARQAIELEEQHRQEQRMTPDEIAFLKALRLAPSLEIMEALLRGERVARSGLDPFWVEAYGL